MMPLKMGSMGHLSGLKPDHAAMSATVPDLNGSTRDQQVRALRSELTRLAWRQEALRRDLELLETNRTAKRGVDAEITAGTRQAVRGERLTEGSRRRRGRQLTMNYIAHPQWTMQEQRVTSKLVLCQLRKHHYAVPSPVGEDGEVHAAGVNNGVSQPGRELALYIMT